MSGQSLKDCVRRKDLPLATQLDNVWSATEEIRARSSSYTEHGHIHAATVERNIWRLLSESSGTGRQNALASLSPYELFLLSAAACCHDIGMSISPPPDSLRESDIAEATSKFIEANSQVLGLTKQQARDIASIVPAHEVTGQAARRKLDSLSEAEAGPGGIVRLQRLDALLKAADLLNVDISRVPSLLVEPETLAESHRTWQQALSSIRGWTTNGEQVVLYAAPQTESQQTALNEVMKYMKVNQWPIIAQYLKQYGFPHELRLEIESPLFSGSQNDEQSGTAEKMLSIRARLTQGQIDEVEAVDLLVHLISALNAYHITCGGNGLILDDWHVSMPITALVED